MMSQDQLPERIAASKLRIAQQRLLEHYPFHAAFVALWKTEEAAVRTVGVTVRDGRIVMVYAPRFVTGCTLPELTGVLHHEVNHLLFGHVFADPKQFPDRQARVIAEEVTVNEWVPELLPGHPITLDHFPELPALEDTDTRYVRLACPSAKAVHPQPLPVPKSSAGVPKKSAAVQKIAGSEPDAQPEGATMPTPLDGHDLWAEIRQSGVMARLAVRAAVQEAKARLTPAQWQRLPAPLRQRIEMAGREPGIAVEQLRACKAPANAWKVLLRRYVRQATAPEFVLSRPPRRFPHLLGIVPGKLRRPEKARVLAAIDTSGSLATADLERIAAELAHLHRVHTVVVVECDTVIHAVYPFRPPLGQVHGRGGTDLRPPLEPAVLRQIRPDFVVYFTDGHGPAPSQPPRVPMVWCLTANGRRPTAWGRVIHLPDARVQ